MREDIKCISCVWIHNRKSMNFVFNKHLYSIKQTVDKIKQFQYSGEKYNWDWKEGEKTVL